MADVRDLGAVDAAEALSGGAALIAPVRSPGQHAQKLARSLYTGSIAAVLRERIISGALPDGAPLAEVRLADQLSVSRGPVRNALQVLEGEGLVSTLANGRTVVVGFGSADLRDLLDTRFAFESTAVQWGMEKQRPLDEILASFDEMQAEGTSTPRLVDLDVGFHQALVALSGSRFLVQGWLAVAPVIHTVITLGNRRLARREPEQNYERIITSHQLIVDALLAGKVDDVIASLKTQFAVTSEVFESEAQ